MNAILPRKKMRLSTAALAIATALLGAGSLHSPPAVAVTGYCSNCGNWWTQALEKIEAVNTQLNTARQLQDALRQAMSLPDRMFRDITGDLQQVVSVYNDARSIGKDMMALDNEFREQFAGYQSYLNSNGAASSVMPGRYEKWASSGLDNARTALEAAGINVSSFDEESKLLDGMLTRSSSAAGRLQAIQAGNEIAAQNVQQLQKLRDMMQTQIIMQANYMAIQAERIAIDDANREKLNAVRPTNSGRYKEF